VYSSFARVQVHVHPLALTHALTCKPASDLALVSDAIMSATDQQPKAYSGRMIEVCCGVSHAAAAPTNDAKSASGSPPSASAKRVVVKGSDTLYGGCGSSLSMFHNAVRVCGVPLERAVAMCTSTPARIACLKDVGSLSAGYWGDVLLFNEALELQTTLIGGTVVFQQKQAATASN
jgi:N-acetylglucosamine-6-phosphate deacetylase